MRVCGARASPIRKRFKPEEIVAKLRQVEVLQSQGMVIADAVRQIGVTEVTYYRWRREYGGMRADQLKRLKVLEKETDRLRRAVSALPDRILVASDMASVRQSPQPKLAR